MSPRIRRQLRPLLAVIAMALTAVAVAAYILPHQRFRFPLIQPKPFELEAELSTAQAVTPGQGQTVRVSGVRVGDIGRVQLRDGRAIVSLQIDPDFKDLIHTDATALLRPKTGLKDMFLEVDPGGNGAPVAAEGWTIPLSHTAPDVNLDEVAQMLDTDTRAYVQQLIGGAAQGLHGRGDALRELLRRFEPTTRDLARVTGRVARRRAALRRLVGALRRIDEELAGRDDQVATLVKSSSAALGAIAQEDSAVSSGVARLPAALRQTRVTLDHVRALGDELGPTATQLRPVVRELGPAARALTELAADATPIVRDDLRPFARAARPLARELTAPAKGLANAVAPTRRAVRVANRASNMTAYNRDGREGPGDANRDEGYLFWLAWATHDGVEIFRTADAHGPFYALSQQSSCASMQGLAEGMGQGDPLLGTVLGGLQGAFTDPRICGSSVATGGGAFARRMRAGPLVRRPPGGDH